MEFMRVEYGKDYKPNSRETIRRQTIHQFEQARLVDRNPDDPDPPTNSGKNAYRLTDEVAEVLKAFGTAGFDKAVAAFIGQFGTLEAAYERARASHQIPLRPADGSTVYLSPGEHNALQVAIIEDFGPRFAPGAIVLYVGNTAKKQVIYDQDQFARIGVPITERDKLPDVVLFDPAKNWSFLISPYQAFTASQAPAIGRVSDPWPPNSRHESDAVIHSGFHFPLADRLREAS